jgi:hypothetical protein
MLINTLDIQMDTLVNPPNIVVDDIGDITWELGMGPHTIINTSGPNVANLSPSSPKVTKLENLMKGDSNSNHALIN